MVKQKATVSSRHNTRTRRDCAVCTRQTQIQSRQNPSTEKGKWTKGFTPNQEANCNLHLLGDRKSLYPKSVTRHIKYTPRHTPHIQEELDNAKQSLCGCFRVFSVPFCSGILCFDFHFWISLPLTSIRNQPDFFSLFISFLFSLPYFFNF